MREAPTYAGAVQRGVVGDDPLGLAPTNERLYNSAFPGFNNYVRHIRVYAALCWMTQQVGLALKKLGTTTTGDARRTFESSMEKMELALVWANQGVLGIAGSQRIFPDHDNSIDFQFGAFGTSRATLFDAATYRPSLTYGLKFLAPISSGVYGCLPAGESIADAFDSAVRELPEYHWLKATDVTTGKRSQVERLRQALDVMTPSPAEQSAFLANFFPSALDETASNDDRARWLTLRLMLKSVDAVCQHKKSLAQVAMATTKEVRACMARGIVPDGTSVLEPDLERVQAWWAVLQVRQLHRLALEAIYCVVERWIAERETGGGGQSLSECVSQLSQAVLAHLHDSLHETVAQLEEHFMHLQGSHSSLYEAAARRQEKEADASGDEAEDENEADIFEHIRRLQDKASLAFDDDGACTALAYSYIALVACAVETENLSHNEDAMQTLRADRDSCSLLRMSELVRRFRGASVTEFMGHLIKDWVVLRHFAVVGTRSVPFDGKNRFRIVMGDYGLERFDKSARLSTPGLSQDRLEHALLLCEQGGLLKATDGGYRLTTAGRRRLS